MGKTLKNHLGVVLTEQISQCKALEKKASFSLRVLKNVNPRNAKYKVVLTSCWRDYGEKQVVLEVEGSMRKAIEAAEAEFKRVNSRSDVQADYDVQIQVGQMQISVPMDYWAKYKERH